MNDMFKTLGRAAYRNDPAVLKEFERIVEEVEFEESLQAIEKMFNKIEGKGHVSKS